MYPQSQLCWACHACPFLPAFPTHSTIKANYILQSTFYATIFFCEPFYNRHYKDMSYFQHPSDIQNAANHSPPSWFHHSFWMSEGVKIQQNGSYTVLKILTVNKLIYVQWSALWCSLIESINRWALTLTKNNKNCTNWLSIDSISEGRISLSNCWMKDQM